MTATHAAGIELRCPECRAGAVHASTEASWCEACGVHWPHVLGLPYLVREAAAPLREEIDAQERAAPLYEDATRIATRLETQGLRTLALDFAPAGALVLDVGCGPGLLAASYPELEVFGVDVTPGLLARAARRAARVTGAEAARLPFADATFERVFARDVLHHVMDPEAVLRELHRVMTPGGELRVQDPRAFRPLEAAKRWLRRGNPAFASTHTAFERRRYRRMLESAGFEVLRFEDRDPVGLLLATLLDFVRAGRRGAAGWAAACSKLDAAFERGLRPLPGLRTFGFTMAVRARRRA